MLRRSFLATPLAAFAQAPAKFEASWDSIGRHTVPRWFEDAKLGIFIHWGLYSVPAWAPPSGELGKVDWAKWFYVNPYAEWYLNTLRLSESETAKRHAAKYGAGFDYYRFAETFNAETRKWDPAEWASLFKDVGARYAVLTTKHHDGFTLWPSRVKNPRRAGLTATRDLVGELTAAVRGAGMKMGLYYSGGLDWTFEESPIRTLPDLKRTAPKSEEYARYADGHWRELIERYEPAVLWNDISYPALGQAKEIFADYYNRFPEGLVNDRFSAPFADFTTPEYARYDKITEKKWESCRGLGFSFGYNQAEGPEHVLPDEELIALVVDIVSKNGNLLLNIGPRPDGSISEIQRARLKALGAWLKVNGEGIFETRPWVRAAAGDVRFTKRGGSVYAFFLKRGVGAEWVVPGVMAAEGSKMEWLGGGAAEWRQAGRDVVVRGAPAGIVPGLKMTPTPWQVVQA